MKLISLFIKSNIYISLAAVLLTLGTQIQLGLKPQLHPYLFIIFFATLLEYNVHRLISIFNDKEILNSDKFDWIRENLIGFYLLVLFSAIGLTIAVLWAKLAVLMVLAPIALLTLLYSLPFGTNKAIIFRLREVPYLKVFLIAFVWSSATILLPIIKSDAIFSYTHVITMLLERFFFVLAITIPFDVRDIEDDKKAGLKTLPAVLNATKSYLISYLAIFSFAVIAILHYSIRHEWLILWALSISGLTTFIFLYSKRIRTSSNYHYGILDGTILFQGLLMVVFYYINTAIQ